MKNMVIAFALNFAFAILKVIGGLFTNSITILSDAIQDIGDALTIGIFCINEKRSRRPADNKFTFGYSRYSVLSAFKNSLILITSSLAIITSTAYRIIKPQEIHYNGMLIFATIGLAIHLCAAIFTRKSNTFNQKAVNLHMVKDVLNWIIIVIGALIMKFTDFATLDIILSLGTSMFVLLKAIKNMQSATNMLLEKTPSKINIDDIRKNILSMNGVISIHNLRVWDFDEKTTYAIMHIVTTENYDDKEKIKEYLKTIGVTNSTIEIEHKQP